MSNQEHTTSEVRQIFIAKKYDLAIPDWTCAPTVIDNLCHRAWAIAREQPRVALGDDLLMLILATSAKSSSAAQMYCPEDSAQILTQIAALKHC